MKYSILVINKTWGVLGEFNDFDFAEKFCENENNWFQIIYQDEDQKSPFRVYKSK